MYSTHRHVARRFYVCSMHNSGGGCAYTRAPRARASASIYQTFASLYFNRFTPLRDTQNTTKPAYSGVLDPPDGVSRSGVPRLNQCGDVYFQYFLKKIPRAGTFFARISECQHNKPRKRFLRAFHDDQESSHK